MTTTTPILHVAELFGPTVQGEGRSLGRRASFVRLGGCNLHCSWCDTKFTWDASSYALREEIRPVPVDDVLDRIARHRTGLLVVTGGEPLLHQRTPGWEALLAGASDLGLDVEVETNGTRSPSPRTIAGTTAFNVSPKLGHAGDPVRLRIDVPALRDLLRTGKAIFKFVVRDTGDLDEVAGIAALAGIPDDLVWVMAEGTAPAELLARQAAIADRVVERGFNLTTRLHALLWPQERNR
ncbi:7-carboxy-7-deazaguanine synthase QueE [Umezawaea sp. Da 62-37]|uniref:7-carboxy-7-deazaguanine synthase QueE n=1 Tax=Umezawaea sp. Da 62-37 TaxID=3075927 RepID=UPI0028F73A45|nr:7-carboxy-7-deazaguanine synthase QueE [Umezawaea sp. Da 62-37]WNV88000.1 7-carboxy-7-deazaguanine synthase QueE [Umezawaea sp. Da 62-37]